MKLSVFLENILKVDLFKIVHIKNSQNLYVSTNLNFLNQPINLFTNNSQSEKLIKVSQNNSLTPDLHFLFCS